MLRPTKTFSEILEEGYEYPEYIPQELCNVITSWYQFRHVCDDEKFQAFFNRVLFRDYDRYEQLLRIDPTVSDYDWLVQTYRERMLERSTTGSSNLETETTGENSTSYGKTITAVTDDDSTKTKQGTEGRTISIDDSESDTLTRQLTDKVVHSGSSSGTTSNPGYTDTTSESANGKTMGKDMPMSNTYTGTSGLPGSFDWSNPSTQAESQTDTDRTTSRSYDSSTSTSGTDDYTNTDTANGTDTRAITRDNSRTDSATKSDSETYADDKTVKTTEGGKDTQTKSGTVATTGTKSESGTDKEIYTGRNEDPATLLRRASAFIANSSAWEWLKARLDVCFIQVYDIDNNFLYW